MPALHIVPPGQPMPSFNPRPAVRPGDAHAWMDANMTHSEFQSAPGREAGRCVEPQRQLHRSAGFNPRPAVRPGDAD